MEPKRNSYEFDYELNTSNSEYLNINLKDAWKVDP